MVQKSGHLTNQDTLFHGPKLSKSERFHLIHFTHTHTLYTHTHTQFLPVSNARITNMCCVVDTMWIGTDEGQLFLFDALTKNEILTRQLALLPGQAISNITHIPTLRQVLVTRSDGCVLLFDEVTQEHKLPDDSRYDNRLNGTQLPVRSVFRTPEKLPIFTAQVVGASSEDKKTVWCGTGFEMILVIDIQTTGLGYCRKCYNRPRNDITAGDHVTDLTLMEREGDRVVWALTQPHNYVHCWSTVSERSVMTVDCTSHSPSPGMCVGERSGRGGSFLVTPKPILYIYMYVNMSPAELFS